MVLLAVGAGYYSLDATYRFVGDSRGDDLQVDWEALRLSRVQFGCSSILPRLNFDASDITDNDSLNN